MWMEVPKIDASLAIIEEQDLVVLAHKLKSAIRLDLYLYVSVERV